MDAEKVLALLQILKEAHGFPKLKALQDTAEAELTEMAAEAQKALDEKKKEAAEKEAAEKAKAKAEAKTEAPEPKAIPSATLPAFKSNFATELERRT